MRLSRDQTLQKHQDMVDYFNSLHDKKEQIGSERIRVHSYKYCLHKTASRFYVSWKTVENIINGWGRKTA